jgi:phage N-6-adenine-methyltransferase
LNDEFHFTLDVCASADNHKCARYFDEQTDGLAQSWENETWWCNPPYGRAIGRWTLKAAVSSLNSVGVMLLPARTDTKYFHEDLLGTADELRFIRGRLYFGGATSPAPFPSVLAIFRPRRIPLPRLTSLELTKAERGAA